MKVMHVEKSHKSACVYVQGFSLFFQAWEDLLKFWHHSWIQNRENFTSTGVSIMQNVNTKQTSSWKTQHHAVLVCYYY